MRAVERTKSFPRNDDRPRSAAAEINLTTPHNIPDAVIADQYKPRKTKSFVPLPAAY
jgi:hypothetical protein